MSTDERLSEYDVEQWIGRLLQIGVLLAAAVTLVGGILLLREHGASVPVFSVFHGQPGNLTSLIGVLRCVGDGRSDSIVQLGVVLLIATPIARVAFTLVAFAMQRDRTYVFITLLVLALLLYGLLFSKA